MSIPKITDMLTKWDSLGGDQLVITTPEKDFVFRGRSYTTEDYITLADGPNFFLINPVNISSYGFVSQPLNFTSVSGPLSVTFYEGTNYSSSTDLTIFCRSRIKPVRSPELIINSGATGTVKGTKLFTLGGGNATNPLNTIGGDLSNRGLILWNNEDKILVEANNETGGELKTSYSFTWFELG